MRRFRFLVFALLWCAVCAASGQSWSPLKHQPTFNARNLLLLTDGTVICQQSSSQDWFKLTPDSSGSYVNGTWSQVASLPSGYAPLYYASAVLPDGKVLIEGGEYNKTVQDETTLGALYDPVADQWTSVSPPTGWTEIGDSPCTVLADGTFLLPYRTSTTTLATFDESNLSWNVFSLTGKNDIFGEEGWTLLPDGSVFTAEVKAAPKAQRFLPSTTEWVNAGLTPQNLVQSSEIGPQVLRPDGTVVVFGANGHNAVYTPPTTLTGAGSWASLPDFPIVNGNQIDMADGAACLLPDGDVLCAASEGVYKNGLHIYLLSGSLLKETVNIPNAANITSYRGTMLMLPTGQVMLTTNSKDVEIYTPARGQNNNWAPSVTSYSQSMVPGQVYSITGTQFNGMSQCSAYGDDCTNATNYPIIRITNLSSGHKFYCREFNPSTMGVATGNTPVTTAFQLPTTVEFGSSSLQVVANGIASASQPVLIVPQLTGFTITPSSVYGGFSATGKVTIAQVASSAGVQVSLQSPISAVQVPATVLIAAGQTSATFTISTSPVGADTGGTLVASLANFVATANLNVKSAIVSYLGLSPNPATSGDYVLATISLNALAALGGDSVSLSSDTPSVLTVPATVTIPAGHSYDYFYFRASPVSSDKTVTITATRGTGTVKASVVVAPATISAIAPASASVIGSQPLNLQPELNGQAGPGGTTVLLSSSNTAVAKVPASTVVPQGMTMGVFQVTTSPVSANTEVTITGTTASASKTATVTVKTALISSFTLSPSSVTGGSSITATLVLDAFAGPSGDTITYQTNPAGIVIAPSSTVIPAGHSYAYVGFTTNKVTTATTVTVTAVGVNNSVSAKVIVNP